MKVGDRVKIKQGWGSVDWAEEDGSAGYVRLDKPVPSEARPGSEQFRFYVLDKSINREAANAPRA